MTMQRRSNTGLGAVISHALGLAGLTPLQAYVLARRLDGLRLREIAEEKGITHQTVYVALTRAQQKMGRVSRRTILSAGKKRSCGNGG